MALDKTKKKPNPVLYGFLKVVLSAYYAFFRLKSTGTENVPPESDPRGVILASNHASFLDPPLLGITSPRTVTFLAKDYLFKVFLLGSVLRGLSSFPIKTEADDFKTIRDLIRVLKAGRCLIVFPEGTRSEDGNLKAAESGVGFLAMKSEAWVVPAYIRGAYEAMPKGRNKIKYGGPMSVRFGKAFIPAEDSALKSAPDPNKAAADRIMAEIARLKEETEKSLK